MVWKHIRAERLLWKIVYQGEYYVLGSLFISLIINIKLLIGGEFCIQHYSLEIPSSIFRGVEIEGDYFQIW